MSPQEFADCLRQEVLESNSKTYQDLLSTPREKVRDPVWAQIIDAYATMSSEQKSALQLAMRQAVADTVSNVLGVLDGSSLLWSYREEFTLTYGASAAKLNGDLATYFLAALEEQG